MKNNLGLTRWFVNLFVLTLSIFTLLGFNYAYLYADSMSASDQQALFEYPNWVANNSVNQCGSVSGTGGTVTSTSPGIPSLTGSTPAEQAFNYYVSQGLSAMAAAGLVGNFMQESAGNTENLDPTATNSNGAHGIGQWMGGRLANLVSFASSKSTPEDNLATQLAFSWQELTGSYSSSVLSPLKNASSASQAADIVNTNYEASGVPSTQREANAIIIFNKYGAGSGGVAGSVGGVTGCAAATSTTTSSNISAYENPLRAIMANHTIFARRIDQGVDYGGQGPIYALGDGTVDQAYPYNSNSGWPGINGASSAGGYVSYTLTDGPAAGKIVYFAENCQPTVTVNQQVTPNTVICQMQGETASWIETGWAASASGTATMAGNCWDTVSSAFGVNFSQLLQKLGAPPGITQEPNPPCQLPTGWPTWQ